MTPSEEKKLKKVRVVINGKETDVWEGYRLWDAAIDLDAKLWHVCGGNGDCTTCAVVAVSGLENLSPPTWHEKLSLGLLRFPLKLLGPRFFPVRFLFWIRRRWRGRPVRLACQAYVRGPVEVVGLFGKTSKEAARRAGVLPPRRPSEASDKAEAFP
jgi:ferredoxin